VWKPPLDEDGTLATAGTDNVTSSQRRGARSVAAARQEPSGELQTTSVFEVAGLEVLGVSIGRTSGKL